MLWQTVPILHYPLTETFTPDIDATLRNKKFHVLPSQCDDCVPTERSPDSSQRRLVLQHLECFDQVTAPPSFLEDCEFPHVQSLLAGHVLQN